MFGGACGPGVELPRQTTPELNVFTRVTIRCPSFLLIVSTIIIDVMLTTTLSNARVAWNWPTYTICYVVRMVLINLFP